MQVVTRNETRKFSELKTIINDRQAIEKEMAEQLLKAFDTNQALINILRAYIAKGAKHIQHLCELKGGDLVFKKAYGDARNYEWVKNNDALGSWYGFKAFLEGGRNIPGLNASQCSDIIRFYGEITEAAAGVTGLIDDSNLSPGENKQDERLIKRGRLLNEQRKSYQRPAGVTHNEWGTLYRAPERDGTIWVKNLTTGSRLRVSPLLYKVSSKKGLYPLKKNGKFELETDAGFMERLKLLSLYRQSQTKTEQALIGMKCGISRWMQLDGDMVNKMNKVFGLAHGATISGTTTDTLYFFDRVTTQKEYLEKALPLRERFNESMAVILYMLPLATIVGNAHHTTIEVALPLNLNLGSKFEYIIGRYESLKPKDMDEGLWPGIDRVLAQSQSEAANRLILIYYKQGTSDPEGYIKFDSGPEDMAVWDDLARGDARLISLFQGFSNYPTKREVAKLHVKVSQKLFGQKENAVFSETVSERRAHFQ